MKVIVATSVSWKIAHYARLTIPHTVEYCLRHGYSHLVMNGPYEEAAKNIGWIARLLGEKAGGYGMIWGIDADCVITDMAKTIHDLPCLGPHVTVCEEGIVGWNRVNCGSIVWKDTPEVHRLLAASDARYDEWKGLPCQWQSWIQGDEFKDVITVAPLRSFNSCAWTHPGGAIGEPGVHWQPGDFVFHPCGVYPPQVRARCIEEAIRETRR